MNWEIRLAVLDRMSEMDRVGSDELSDAQQLAAEWKTCAVGELWGEEAARGEMSAYGMAFLESLGDNDIKSAKLYYRKIRDFYS